MNENDFNKGIDELNEIRLTVEEKSRILDAVLNTPISSPYVPGWSIFHMHTFRAVLAVCLIAVVSFGTLGYASNNSLPGDKLYGMKVSLLEPALDVVNTSPEAKIEWAAAKVDRRIAEAEQLAEENRLDDEKSQELELQVEKNSRAFVKTVEKNSRDAEQKKEEFRKKFAVESELNAGAALFMAAAPREAEIESSTNTEDQNIELKTKVNVEAKSGNKERIEKLKRKAVEVLDEERFKRESNDSLE